MESLPKVLEILAQEGDLMQFLLIVLVFILLFSAVIIYIISNSFINKKIQKYIETKLGEDWNDNIKELIADAVRDKEDQISSIVDSHDKEQFKKMNILALNDNGTLQDIALRLGLKNFNRKMLGDDETTLKNYDMVILYLDNNTKQDETLLSYKEKFLGSMDRDALLIVHIEGNINRGNIKEFNYVTTNSTYTLIERLHTAYSVRKIMRRD